MKIHYKTFISSLILCFIPAVVGGLATSQSVNTWYPTLAKPILNPPSFIFAPVWTILYIMQGISLYLISISKNDIFNRRIAKIFFYHQLALNLLWPIIFFYFKQPRLGLMEIVLLLIFVIFTTITAYRVNKTAGLLLVPYLIWISFATYLNLMIAVLNH